MKSQKQVFSVSELTMMLKKSLETSFPSVWIQGEVSNLKRHSSGHVYFTLKDENAQIACVLWRSRAASVAVELDDGLKVQAQGAITVYPPRGNYQLDVVRLIPVGIGELQAAFEKLKAKLAAEGLFAPERKKPIPPFPRRVGIVTSETGAALRDILSVIVRRFPAVEVLLLPVRVQGAGAAQEIAAAIRDMNAYGEIDVMIVGRGGGSLEDLWPFNEEVVARAIFDSRIPVVSAVGHEIDFSISDFVADLRAPTPSAAAELVVPSRDELLETLGNICYTMHQNLSDRIASGRKSVATILGSYAFNLPRQMVASQAQRLDELERSLSVEVEHFLEITRRNHQSLQQRLESVGPGNILKRGYVIVRKETEVVMTSRRLKRGDRATLEFHDGEVQTRVEPQ